MFEQKRLIYPLELIITGCLVLTLSRIKKTRNYCPREVWRGLVVYHIIEMESGWLPIGRDYKPLGLSGYSEWCDYELYKFLIIPKDKIDFSFLKERNPKGKNGYYFFSDISYMDNKKLRLRYIELILGAFLDIKNVYRKRMRELCPEKMLEYPFNSSNTPTQ